MAISGGILKGFTVASISTKPTESCKYMTLVIILNLNNTKQLVLAISISVRSRPETIYLIIIIAGKPTC